MNEAKAPGKGAPVPRLPRWVSVWWRRRSPTALGVRGGGWP